MIGMYMRLSLADEDIGEEHSESNSIRNQRICISQYIEKQEDLKQEEVREYIDDGYSGTNMNRPGFQAMMEGVRKGEIQTVIVKDFSRFARDYIEAGDYIESIFPFMRVRFIAVNEGYDSEENTAGTDFDMAVKNIVNASYSKDLSTKMSATNLSKRGRALYLGGYRPYGFLPDPEDVHKLVIDPVASRYVRKIFDLACEGKKCKEIAYTMQALNVPTPAQYQMERKVVRKEQNCWNRNLKWTGYVVQSILKNEKYKGTYVAKKKVQAAPCSKVIRVNAPEEVIRIENSHCAIVTADIFDQAQKIFKPRTEKGERKLRVYPLKGIVVCGHCGRKLKHYNSVKQGPFYRCDYGTAMHNECNGDKVSEETLCEIVRNALTIHLILFSKAAQLISEHRKAMVRTNTSLENQLRKLEQDRKVVSREKVNSYEEFAEGTISKHVFLEKKDALADKENQIRVEIERIQQEMEAEKSSGNEPDFSEMESLYQVVKDIDNIFTLEDSVVEQFVKEIRVYNQERVEIKWRFEDEIETILSE